MNVLLAAGAVGLAGYALGKRKERRQLANGYVTYHDNGGDLPEYGNIYYGNTGNHHAGRHHRQAQTGYYPTTTRLY
jgi:hypothetical protein